MPLLTQPCLESVLDRVGQLMPTAGKELDSVVGHGIVGGRQHHAEVGVGVGGEKRDCRRGQYANVVHIHTGRRETADDGGRQEFARGARVAPDDGHATVPGELAGLPEHSGGGDREVQREMRSNVLIGEATYAVGTEKSCHIDAFSLGAVRARPLIRYQIPALSNSFS